MYVLATLALETLSQKLHSRLTIISGTVVGCAWQFSSPGRLLLDWMMIGGVDLLIGLNVLSWKRATDKPS